MKVIVVVSAGRSGSTLLDMLLGSVDGFFSGGELRYLWERGLIEQRRCGCGMRAAECEVWSKVLTGSNLACLDANEIVHLQYQVARVRHTRRLLNARNSSERDVGLSRLITAMAALYEGVGRVTGSRVVVDSSKRPSDAALAALLPGIQTYVVHLVRDPRAVAFSWRRWKPEFDHDDRPQMDRQSVVRAAADWMWVNAVASSFPRYAPDVPYLRVRYEDVIRQPSESLSRILAFAGEANSAVPVDDRVITLRPNHTVSGNPSRFSTGQIKLRLDDEWRSALATAPWCAATAITAPSLRRYGYEIASGAPWNRNRARGMQAASVK